MKVSSERIQHTLVTSIHRQMPGDKASSKQCLHIISCGSETKTSHASRSLHAPKDVRPSLDRPSDPSTTAGRGPGPCGTHTDIISMHRNNCENRMALHSTILFN